MVDEDTKTGGPVLNASATSERRKSPRKRKRMRRVVNGRERDGGGEGIMGSRGS